MNVWPHKMFIQCLLNRVIFVFHCQRRCDEVCFILAWFDLFVIVTADFGHIRQNLL